ncbi:MAG: amidohydrolase family protein [Tepidisphaeraceae bacterium]|jgi:cytosine/adenosine deaminase-related metal-dependent hydrolase
MERRSGVILENVGQQLLCAAWVAPMIRAPIRDGAILVDGGRIQDVGTREQLRARNPEAEISDLGSAVILPGLVNAHTHLELSDCQPGPRPAGGFADWLVGMLRRTRISAEEMERAVTGAVAIGVEQCVRFGVTTVGDISRQCRLTRGLLRQCPLRVVSFGEVQAMAQRRGLLEERLAIAAEETMAGPRLAVGITPHAPYSVELDGYRRCLQTAKDRRMPLATHLAETKDEATFLAWHSGPLRELWDQWLTWDDSVPRFIGGPIRLARELGLLDYPTLLAHVNYCDDDELNVLAAGKASVVYCPRTHEFFGHPPHRWREMRRRGINVAVGTDSCASSPDLNLVEELRLLHRLTPDEPVENLWELATTRAARALGVPDAGAIRVGDFADLVTFACSTPDPMREILEGACVPSSVWIEGNRVT